jgi:hypothetical protein
MLQSEFHKISANLRHNHWFRLVISIQFSQNGGKVFQAIEYATNRSLVLPSSVDHLIKFYNWLEWIIGRFLMISEKLIDSRWLKCPTWFKYLTRRSSWILFCSMYFDDFFVQSRIFRKFFACLNNSQNIVSARRYSIRFDFKVFSQMWKYCFFGFDSVSPEFLSVNSSLRLIIVFTCWSFKTPNRDCCLLDDIAVRRWFSSYKFWNLELDCNFFHWMMLCMEWISC